MKIDVFKTEHLFHDLEQQVSPLIISTIRKNFYFDNSGYNRAGKMHLISWFNPDELFRNCLPQPYRGDLNFRKNKKFNLQIHYPTYTFLYLVHVLYNKRKDILIEDVCCGIGRTEIYLKQLGFTNFHLIDNFSQISPPHLNIMLKEADIKCKINWPDMNPVISYISAYPSFPKGINNSIELFCHYANPNMLETLTPLLKNKGFVHLCTDVDNLMIAWCKEEKREEFQQRLEHVKVGE